MGFVDFLITKLVGYDILKSEKELKVSLGNAQRQISSLSQQKEILQESVEGKQGQIISLSQEVTNIKGQIDSKDRNLEQLAESVKTHQKEIERLECVVGEKSEDISILSKRIEEKQRENEELAASFSTKIEELISTVSSKDQEIGDLTEKVEKLDAQNKSKQGTIMNHVKKINALSAELEELKDLSGQYSVEHEELIQLKVKYDTLSSEKTDLIVKVEEAGKENESLEKANKALSDQVTSLEQQLANTPTTNPDEIRELEAQIQKNEETIQAKTRDIEILNSEKQDLTSQFEEVCRELNAVRSEKDSLSEKISAIETLYKNLQDDYADLSKNYTDLQEKLSTLEVVRNENEEVDQPDLAEEQEIVPDDSSISEVVEKTNQEGGNLSESDTDESLETSNDIVIDIAEPNKDDEHEPLVVKPSSTRKITKTKEEEAIEQSGDSIVDFPLIVNDSNKQTQRTIEYVYDENNQIVYADEFFDRSAEEIAHVSRKMSEAEISGNVYWTCGLCHHRVKIAHRTYNSKESLFFIHATRDHYCPWLNKSTSSKDVTVEESSLLSADELILEDALEEQKPKSRELKEKIYSLLTSQTSSEMGVEDVKMDEIIRSNVPYMRWRRPDISFVYNGRKVVIELQKKSHDLDTIVDRDVFFRLNDIQILWVFGSDSDSSYDYMRKLNYKNTMFDNHRNVFVFDKEAQRTSEENNTLFLKCNWLDEDDNWYFRIDNSGANGKLVNLSDFVFDDEYCKPYHFDANEEYFLKHPEARDAYIAKKMSREELKKAIEEKWMRDSSYEEAQAQMRQRNAKATPYCVKGLWGFRFNTTVIIPPIFTVEPKDLLNGYYLVRQGSNLGIVNYYGEKVVSWDGFIQCEDLNYDSDNKRLLFMREGLWGVADLSGKEMIPATYQAISAWASSVYKVRMDGKWGLCNIENKQLTSFIYDKIEDLLNSRALATKTHPTKTWMTVSGYIDVNGKEQYSAEIKQEDGLSIVQNFELWGILDENNDIILPCQYEEIVYWAEHLYRVRENGKWGIYDVKEHDFRLKTVFDSIGELKDGVAKTVFAKLESAIDITGKEIAQEVVQLQNGLKKTQIAGKWGIINANGEVVVNHQYDEIGSFRSRMIGVINNKLIKLNINYAYPIYISGKLINSTDKFHFFNISGVKCVIPESFLKMAGKTVTQICDSNKVCDKLAFSNLMFSQQHFLLRILKPEHLKKVLSHADSKEDYSLGEELTGAITSFKSFAKTGVKKRTKAMVKFSDGRKTMVPRRFFKGASPIESYKIGDSITLRKKGFDDELDQTIWEVL